jgi:hypothetical protein
MGIDTDGAVRGYESPGTKLNSKVLIFDKHLAPIYYKHVKLYD